MKRHSAILALSLVLLGARARAAAQEPRAGDVATTVRVEVVLLDVLALDGKERPVLDLTKEDFDVRIAGKPQALEGFEPPQKPGGPAAERTEPERIGGSTVPVVPDGRPDFHILFIFDLEELPPGAVVNGGRQAVEFAKHPAGAPKISLVSHFGTNGVLLWDETATDRIEAAFQELADTPAATMSGSSLGGGPRGVGRRESGGGSRGFEQRQRTEAMLIQSILDAGNSMAVSNAAYRELSDYLRSERLRVRETLAELRITLEKLAALGGRRHAILFSQGIERVPGANAVAFLDRALQSSRLSADGGLPGRQESSQLEPRGLGGDVPRSTGGRLTFESSPLPELGRFEEWLASSGVMLHFVDPTADAGPAAEFGALESVRNRAGDRVARQEGAVQLVEATGGLVRGLQGALGSLPETLSASYRLAVRVSGVEPKKTYKVAVSVKRKGVKVRARSAYTPSPGPGAPVQAGAPAPELTRADETVRSARRDERRTGVARLASKAIPLTLAWKGKRGPDPDAPAKNLYLLEVRVPHDALRFQPEDDSMVASARITVQPLLLGGSAAEPIGEDLFLSLTGAEYAAAHGTDIVRTLKIALAPGRYELSVAIEDALEKSAGVAKLTVDAN